MTVSMSKMILAVARSELGPLALSGPHKRTSRPERITRLHDPQRRLKKTTPHKSLPSMLISIVSRPLKLLMRFRPWCWYLEAARSFDLVTPNTAAHHYLQSSLQGSLNKPEKSSSYGSKLKPTRHEGVTVTI